MEGWGIIIINDKNPEKYTSYNIECFNDAKKVLGSSLALIAAFLHFM
jgi:hypothetical protein